MADGEGHFHVLHRYGKLLVEHGRIFFLTPVLLVASLFLGASWSPSLFLIFSLGSYELPHSTEARLLTGTSRHYMFYAAKAEKRGGTATTAIIDFFKNTIPFVPCKELSR